VGKKATALNLGGGGRVYHARQPEAGRQAAALQPEYHTMANPFVHIELMAGDVAKAKSFYGQLFDWKLEDVPMGDMTYTMIRVGEGTGGGLMKNPMPGGQSIWVAYVLVDDVKRTTAKAKSLGANVLKDVSEVPGAGWFSILADPTGAMLGLWQPKTA
jgi:predicted enzyme related to lactoylglutathione lyase